MLPVGYKSNVEEKVLKQDEENRKMIEGAKRFSSTIRGMMSQIADLEERMIRMERLHHDLGGKRIIKE